MQETPKTSMNKMTKYFREISVVIICVAVTLSVGYWITIKNEKRDMTLYLHTIKMELEENIKEIERAINFYQYSAEYAHYLQSHDRKSIEPDSIMFYSDNYYSSRFYTFKTNAFDMFKSSGLMRLMNNKELLLSIWNTYTQLNELKKVLDEVDKIKSDHILKEWASFDDVKDINPSQLKKPPLYHFYIMGIPINVQNACEQVYNESKEMISMLEQELGSKN
jgi:hypothetical protein